VVDVSRADPPHDVEAERALIGAAIRDPAVMDRVAINGADFYRAQHQQMWEALRTLNGAHPDRARGLLDAIRDSGQLRPGILDGPYIHTCVEACATPAAGEQYARAVRQTARKRQALQALTRATQRISGTDLDDLDGVLWEAMADVEAVAADSVGPGDVDESRPRRVVVTPASKITPRRVRWCWNDRLALGTLALLAGPEGLGKSTLAYWLAARITRGDLPGEYLGQPRAVLVCATEDSWAHTIVPRLMAASADLGLVFRVEVKAADDITLGLSLPRDIHDLDQAAHQTGAALLILDPLLSRISEALDSHKDGDVRRALEPLVGIADHAGMAIVGLIHHNKSGSTDPLQLVMASKAFTAVARSVHTVIKDPDDDTDTRRLFGTPKNNLGRTDLPVLSFTITRWTYATNDGIGDTGQLVWGDDVDGTIGEALRRANEDPDNRSATEEAADWLSDYLTARGPWVHSAETKADARKAGHNEEALRRARRKLKVKIEYQGYPRQSYWATCTVASRLGETPRLT
jgi:AAA domain/DnaB-like helicase N terminal domain